MPDVAETLPKAYIVTHALDAAAVLTNARVARGWTGEEADARSGMPDRYAAKLEHPETQWGKRGLHITAMWELWLQTFGLVLVIMSREQADSIGAVPAPERAKFSLGGSRRSASPNCGLDGITPVKGDPAPVG